MSILSHALSKLKLRLVVKQDGASTSKEHESVEREPKIFIDCEDEKIMLSKKVRTVETFFVKEIFMEKMVSRMVAKDGFTFNCFCTSSDLRYFFQRAVFGSLLHLIQLDRW